MKKSEFADVAFGIVSEAITRALEGLKKKVSIKIKSAVVKREARFDRYGQELDIVSTRMGMLTLFFMSSVMTLSQSGLRSLQMMRIYRKNSFPC